MWFLIPAGVANLVPPVAARVLPRWNNPMDFGLMFRGQHLFGSHKTVRGLVTGVLFASVVHNLQVLLSIRFNGLQTLAIDPMFNQTWWLGAWLGFTALMGDALKSFIKRQAHIEPGKPWLPWDKIDWILGVLAGSWFLFQFNASFIIMAIIIGLLLSSLGKLLGYWLRINPDWL